MCICHCILNANSTKMHSSNVAFLAFCRHGVEIFLYCFYRKKLDSKLVNNNESEDDKKQEDWV